MIFLAADNEPTMIIMLTEADCDSMRGGRTKFVDRTATKGRKFDKVVFSLHQDQAEIERVLTKAGHAPLLRDLPSPVPQPQEARCAGCNSILLEALLLDGMCIACWRERATTGRATATEVFPP